MNRTGRLLAVALAVLALLGAACGDSGTTTTVASTSEGGAAGPAADIEIVAVDFAYEPDTWRVASGVDVSVSFENAGTLEHNWAILRSPIENEDELMEDMILWEVSSQAGGRVDTAIDLLIPPGTYQIICSIPGHFSAGMVGELIVTE